MLYYSRAIYPLRMIGFKMLFVLLIPTTAAKLAPGELRPPGTGLTSPSTLHLAFFSCSFDATSDKKIMQNHRKWSLSNLRHVFYSASGCPHGRARAHAHPAPDARDSGCSTHKAPTSGDNGRGAQRYLGCRKLYISIFLIYNNHFTTPPPANPQEAAVDLEGALGASCAGKPQAG